MENFTINKLIMILPNFTFSETTSRNFSGYESNWILQMSSNDTKYSQEVHHDAYGENCLSMCSEVWVRSF